jgi:hypothetical protein
MRQVWSWLRRDHNLESKRHSRHGRVTSGVINVSIKKARRVIPAVFLLCRCPVRIPFLELTLVESWTATDSNCALRMDGSARGCK